MLAKLYEDWYKELKILRFASEIWEAVRLVY
jgi:hypothetical protein